uniref:Proteasome component Ecm29 N-terminal domain-containing protein n=1 Tax=Oryza rufipogon TaxID=4529 RepID=A0A0E0RDF1_ORYRU
MAETSSPAAAAAAAAQTDAEREEALDRMLTRLALAEDARLAPLLARVLPYAITSLASPAASVRKLAIGECNTHKVGDNVASKYQSISGSNDDLVFADFCFHTVVYQTPPQGVGCPAGLSVAQSDRVTGKQPLKGDTLTSRKLGILNVIEAMQLAPEIVYPLYLAAASDSQESVTKRGEELLKRKASAVNLEDSNLMKKLFTLFNGTASAENIAAELKVAPAHSSLRVRLMGVFCRSIAAANAFPFDDDKDIGALYGELWEDIPSSERVTLQLYLPEIISLLCDSMSSSSWAGKRKSAKAIKKLCDALGESLSVHHNNILESLLKELPGRFWEVMEILSHINKRVKHRPEISLPMLDLWRIYTESTSSTIVRNFCIVYIEMAFERLLSEDKGSIAPDLLINISNVTEQHQGIILRLVVKAANDQLKLIGPVILSGILRSLDGSSTTEADSSSRDIKIFAYQAIGLLATRMPNLFSNKTDMAIRLFTALRLEEQSLRVGMREALTHLLGDQNDLTQDLASQGMSIVYELGDASMKEQLVHALVNTLSGAAKKKRAIKLMEDSEVFQEGTIGNNPTGGKLSTYKELCSLANEMGQPDLIYKFMDLANYQAAINSKRGAAFGFSKIAKQAGEALQPHLHTLIPRLVRYQYDPDKNIQDSMAHIWKLIVADPKKTIDEHYDLIVEDLLVQSGSRLWRSREASCLALADIIQGRRYGQKLEMHMFFELYSAITKLIFRFDDDKDIGALYGELWEDIPSSERVTLQLYLPEIISLLCDSMSSSSWAGKRKSAKAIKKLCDALGESLSVHHNNILESLLKELPGRFWEGKDAILDALAALCSSCHTAMSAEDSGMPSVILNAVCAACSRKSKLYREAAFSCLQQVITAFKDPGFFNIVFPMLYEVSNRSVICKTRNSSSLTASSSAEQDETEGVSVSLDKVLNCVASSITVAFLQDIINQRKNILEIILNSLSPEESWQIKLSSFLCIKELCYKFQNPDGNNTWPEETTYLVEELFHSTAPKVVDVIRLVKIAQVHTAASECLLELSKLYRDFPLVDRKGPKFSGELAELCESEKSEQAKAFLKQCMDILKDFEDPTGLAMEMD